MKISPIPKSCMSSALFGDTKVPDLLGYGIPHQEHNLHDFSLLGVRF